MSGAIKSEFNRLKNLFGKNSKGISPIIATILLIGVAVFAVGGIYSFTQSKLTDLQSGSEAPRTTLTLPTASTNTNSVFCGSSNGVIMKHQGGDPVPVNSLEISISTESEATPVKVSPDSKLALSAGQSLGLFGVDTGGVSVAIPEQNHCNQPNTEGNVNINEGEEVTVTVKHTPSGTVLFESSTTARGIITSYP